MNTRKRSREKDKRKSRCHDAQVLHCPQSNRLLQFIQANDRVCQTKKERTPTERNQQRERQVMRGIGTGIRCVTCTDALSDTYLRSNFIQVGKGIGHPGQNTYGTYCRYGLTAQTSHPCHIRQAISHLDKGGTHDRHGQMKQLPTNRSLCQILRAKHYV